MSVTLRAEIEKAGLDELPCDTLLCDIGDGVPDWVRKALEDDVVVPRLGCSDTLCGPFFGLPDHLRTIYYRPTELDESAGVVAIKGVQVASLDLPRELERLGSMRPRPSEVWPRSALEHLALVEHKVPMALTRGEAEREFHIAHAVRSKILNRTGVAPRLPTPLIVAAVTPETIRAYECTVKSFLTRRTFDAVRSVLTQGLVVYMYYYPAVPVRVRDQAKNTRVAPATVESWIELFWDFLSVGFIPASLESRGFGSCCGPQNAVVDGGFVDLDSPISIEEIGSVLAVAENLDYSINSMTRSIAIYLGGPDPKVQWTTKASLIQQFINRSLTERAKHESHNVPETLRKVLLAVTDTEQLFSLLLKQEDLLECPC